MNNLEFIAKVAYQERIHRELHGDEHAKPYMEVLRTAAQCAHVKGIFDDATFNEYGLAEGGPFTKPAFVWKMVKVDNESPAVERAIL